MKGAFLRSPRLERHLGVTLVLLSIACPSPPHEYANRHYQDVTHYKVAVTHRTAGGVSVSDGLDDARVDALTDQVELCLANLEEPSAAAKVAWSCLPGFFGRKIDRASFNVFLAPDWTTSDDGLWQTFPCTVDPALCEAKGQHPTPERPCACRAIVQSNFSIIVTPDLRLYASELVRLVSGCGMVWLGSLEACAGIGVWP
jgi:hypothetical protein